MSETAQQRRTFTPADFPPGLLAVPCIPWMWTDAAMAIGRLQNYLSPGSRIAIDGAGSSSIAASRNLATRELDNDDPTRLEWVLCVDADMVPRPDTALRLLAVAHLLGVDMLSALYFTRQSPYRAALWLPGATAMARADELEGLRGVVEVEQIGFGCVLIQRRVFDALERPWFRHPPDSPGLREDTDFCLRARAAGFRIGVDLDHEVPHLTTMPITRELARAWQQTATGRADLAADPRTNTRELLPGPVSGR